jgi:muramoyltetrapeptide carboxypeptidase
MTSLTIYSPAGVVAETAAVRRATQQLKRLGFTVQVDESATAKHQRFAGDDDTRLAAIHRVAKAAPAVALPTRGGYGLTRLLDRIEWKKLAHAAEHGTRWVGYSDLTALQLGLLAHTKTESWCGPMACGDFGLDLKTAELDEITPEVFVEAMTGQLEAVGFRTEAGFDGLEVRGTLWGGNLAVVNTLLGTPHWPKVKGGVLFLEDVNEHPYRIERNLLQLHQAGVLDAQKAIVLGDFSGYKKSPLDRGYTLKSAIAYLRSVTKTPILTGLPFGHVPTKVCLPIGRKVTLAAQGRDAFIAWGHEPGHHDHTHGH